MVKCPYCGFDNEDGSLFCEQCKSDLSGVPSSPKPAAIPVPAMHVPAMHVPAIHVPAAPVAAVLPIEPPMAAILEEPGAMFVDTVPPAIVEAVSGLPSAPIAEALPWSPIDEAPPVVLLDPAPMEAIPVLEPAPVAKAIDVPFAAVPAAAPAFAIPPVLGPATMPAAVMPAVAAAVVPVVPAAPPPPAPAAAAPAADAAVGQPRLKVMRGLKVGLEFPIYAEYNYIGRADDKPVDIDLEDQEPPDRVWCSRQHAVIHFDEASGTITIEDLNSSNGTYVNRARVYPGQKTPLKANDVVQIGTVHLKLLVG